MNFDEIFEQYVGEVYRFLYKLTRDEHLAEEFTQECFYKAYKNMEKYDGSCKLSVWLCQIAKNSYFDYCRKKKALPLDGSIIFDSGMEEALCQKETVEQIHRVLHTLDEPYKEVFTLRVFAEMPYKDISSLFGKSENWSRVVFFRAKEKVLESVKL